MNRNITCGSAVRSRSKNFRPAFERKKKKSQTDRPGVEGGAPIVLGSFSFDHTRLSGNRPKSEQRWILEVEEGERHSVRSVNARGRVQDQQKKRLRGP